MNSNDKKPPEPEWLNRPPPTHEEWVALRERIVARFSHQPRFPNDPGPVPSYAVSSLGSK